jgi:hypothetical protein
MVRRARRVLSLLLVPALFAGACAETEIHDPWYAFVDLPDAYAPNDLALRIAEVGGFTDSVYHLTRVPTISIYGDGRVISERRPESGAFPQHTLPQIVVRAISEEKVRDLAFLALQAGVGERALYDQPYADDYTTTRFTILLADGARHTGVYARGLDDGLSPGDQAARQRLSEFRDKLLDLSATLGDGHISDESPYEPDAVAAVNRAWPYPSDFPVPARPERAWPGPALPGQTSTADASCVEVTGPGLTELLAGAASADEATPWMWEGQRYVVWFRPLLPDESSCTDLGEVTR